MEIDLHGWHPTQIVNTGALEEIVRQAWEMGERRLTLIHGHGRQRGPGPGFVNTNTGFFGLLVRDSLRNVTSLRQWIHYTTVDCSEWGSTSVNLRRNASPTRTSLDPKVWEMLGDGSEPASGT